MIKLKGDGESMAQRVMNKALGGKNASTAPLVDSRGGHGTLNEPTQTARNLGMPSAQRQPQQQRGPNKDWSASSNRINMGAPVMMKSRTNVDANFEDRDHVAESKMDSGDAMSNGQLGKNNGGSDDEFEDEFGEGDEEGGAVAQWRAARLAEIKKKSTKTNEFLGLGHGSYTEIPQDDFLKEVTKSKYVVCHFYHPEFERCKIIDKHLEGLARKHLATKWIKIDANKAPFFVGKLQVKMLPTLIFFKDGIARDRMVGLEDVGATDEFSTEQLEARIAKAGVIITGDKVDEDELEARKRTQNSIRQSNHNQENEDASDEDDD